MYTFVFLLFGCVIKSTTTKAETTTMAPSLPNSQELFAANEYPDFAPQSIHATGTIVLPSQKISGTLDLWVIRDHGTKTTIDINGLGKTEQGYDLKTAWSINPMQGPRVITGKALQEMLKTYKTMINTGLHELYTDSKVVGMQEIRGQQAFHMTATEKITNSPIEIFFDMKNKKIIATFSTINVDQGQFKTKSYTTAYIQIDGRDYPAKVELHAAGVMQEITFDKYEFDSANPPRIAPPPVIRQLMKEQTEAENSSTTP